MKKLTTLITLSLIIGSISPIAAQQKPLQGFEYGEISAPDGKEWESPGRLSLNKEQPRAWFFNFDNVDNARKVLPENSPYYKSLDGEWKFNWVGNPSERPVDFFKPSYDVSKWDNIEVPGSWNVQGIQKDGTQKYGTPIYVNQPVPFMHKVAVDDWRGGVMRTPPENWTMYKNRNEVGSYRRTFTVPSDWKGREIYINFDGVDSFFYIWINGKYVGFSKNSRNTASFDITKYLIPGENTLAVEVYRNSDASFLEAQDMFRLPGIFRTVSLTSTYPVQVRDLRIVPDFDAAYTDGILNIDADIRNLANKVAKGYSISYSLYENQLYSDENSKVTGAEVSVSIPEVSVDNTISVKTILKVVNPKKWSAEQPNRYVLVGELKDKKGKVVETFSAVCGFRKVEIRDTQAKDDEFGLAGRYYYINNMPVKLKGTNRHENSLERGHAITREQMEKEIMLMKQGNINHVRNSHYNDNPYWYYLCDKYGIYLEDEANLESHEYYYGAASLSHPIEWRDAHVARNMEMTHSHINHPSIVIWSLGNEAGPGKNFVECYNAIKEFDTSRPIQYERNNDIVDMGSNQYPSIPWVREAVKGKMDIKYPFHISEYAHSMGNAVGNLVDYWDAIESTNFFCGGAIWDWVDQSIWNYTPDGIKYMAYGGDFGDTPNNGMFCMNGIMFPDFTPKPQYAEVKRIYQNVGVTPVDITKGTVEIFNKNYFTSLDNLSPRWILTKNGVEVASGENLKRPCMSVGPREKQTWSIPYDYSNMTDDGEYYVTLQFVLNEDMPWAKKGYVQAEVQFPVKTEVNYFSLEGKGSKPVFSSTKESEIVSGDGWKVKFDNANGSISELVYNGKKIITPGNGPVLNALRAPTDNDIWIFSTWFENGLHNLRHKTLDHKAYQREDGTVVVQYTVESQAPCTSSIEGGGLKGNYVITDGREFGPDDFKFITNQVWTVYPDGSVELESAINSNSPTLILPRLGYSMTLPQEFGNYTYYGRGPINNFNDRLTSQKVGLYHSTVADQFVNFPKPQSMGNREGIRWNALTDSSGDGVQFIATEGTMSASALPWDDLEMTLAPHPYQLPKSKGTTLHLDKKVTGLGGASCGQGGPLAIDRELAGAQTFGFIIRPVSMSTDLQKQASVSASGQLPLNISRDRAGMVRISTADENADLRFMIVDNKNLKRKNKKSQTGVKYIEAVNMRDGGKIVAWDANAPQLTVEAEFDRIESIPVEVVYASSQEPGEEASYLTDGDPSTIWQTTYGVTVAQYPHWVDFDCGEVKNIKGFSYLPRQTGTNGNIKDWRLEISNDSKDWKEVASGTFEKNNNEKKVSINPVNARYVRFVGVSSQNGADYAAGAEFTILAE